MERYVLLYKDIIAVGIPQKLQREFGVFLAIGGVMKVELIAASRALFAHSFDASIRLIFVSFFFALWHPKRSLYDR